MQFQPNMHDNDGLAGNEFGVVVDDFYGNVGEASPDRGFMNMNHRAIFEDLSDGMLNNDQ